MPAAVVVLVSSCRTNDPDEMTADLRGETDNAILDRENTNMISFTTNTGNENSGLNKSGYTSSGCGNVTVEILDTSDGWPRKAVIDFGSTYINTCSDSRNRKGKIIAVFPGPWNLRQPGDTVTVTPEDYYVDGVHYEGTRYLITEDSVTIRIIADNTMAHFPDGATATWSCNRTRKMLDGEATMNPWDDVYEHEGSASGTNRQGKSFTLSTRFGNPLIQKGSCKWIVQGILDFTPDGLTSRAVDFGSGGCDNQATVTVESKIYPITLQ